MFVSKLILLCLLGGIGVAGCSSPTVGWVEVNDSCIFESETPPLRRVINYIDTELCDRQPIAKKKRQKRLRELLDED